MIFRCWALTAVALALCLFNVASARAAAVAADDAATTLFVSPHVASANASCLAADESCTFSEAWSKADSLSLTNISFVLINTTMFDPVTINCTVDVYRPLRVRAVAVRSAVPSTTAYLNIFCMKLPLRFIFPNASLPSNGTMGFSLIDLSVDSAGRIDFANLTVAPMPSARKSSASTVFDMQFDASPSSLPKPPLANERTAMHFNITRVTVQDVPVALWAMQQTTPAPLPHVNDFVRLTLEVTEFECSRINAWHSLSSRSVESFIFSDFLFDSVRVVNSSMFYGATAFVRVQTARALLSNIIVQHASPPVQIIPSEQGQRQGLSPLSLSFIPGYQGSDREKMRDTHVVFDVFDVSVGSVNDVHSSLHVQLGTTANVTLRNCFFIDVHAGIDVELPFFLSDNHTYISLETVIVNNDRRLVDNLKLGSSALRIRNGGNLNSPQLTSNHTGLVTVSLTDCYIQNYHGYDGAVHVSFALGEYSDSGGPILFSPYVFFNIDNSSFRNNSALGGGGAIAIESSLPLSSQIRNTYFFFNTADFGGAVSLRGLATLDLLQLIKLNLLDSLLAGNSALNSGGAIDVSGNGASLSLDGCILSSLPQYLDGVDRLGSVGELMNVDNGAFISVKNSSLRARSGITAVRLGDAQIPGKTNPREPLYIGCPAHIRSFIFESSDLQCFSGFSAVEGREQSQPLPPNLCSLTYNVQCQGCPRGLYTFAFGSVDAKQAKAVQCHPCPEGALCEYDSIVPLEGFWLERNNLYREAPEKAIPFLAQCPKRYCASGAFGETCAPGRAGVLCGACAANHSMILSGLETSCEPYSEETKKLCESVFDVWTVLFAVAFVVFAFVYVLFRFARRGGFQSGFVRLCVHFGNLWISILVAKPVAIDMNATNSSPTTPSNGDSGSRDGGDDGTALTPSFTTTALAFFEHLQSVIASFISLKLPHPKLCVDQDTFIGRTNGVAAAYAWPLGVVLAFVIVAVGALVCGVPCLGRLRRRRRRDDGSDTLTSSDGIAPSYAGRFAQHWQGGASRGGRRINNADDVDDDDTYVPAAQHVPLLVIDSEDTDHPHHEEYGMPSRAILQLRRAYVYRVVATGVAVLEIVFTATLSTSLVLLHCVPVPLLDGSMQWKNSWRLFCNGDVQCLQSWQWAVLVLAVFITAIPLALEIARRRAVRLRGLIKGTVTDERSLFRSDNSLRTPLQLSAWHVALLDSMDSPFTRGNGMWGLVLYIERFLVMIVVYLIQIPPLRSFLVSFLMATFLFFDTLKHPWRVTDVRHLARASFWLLMIGSLLASSSSRVISGTSAILSGATTLVFLLWLAFVAYFFYRAVQRARRRRLARKAGNAYKPLNSDSSNSAPLIDPIAFGN